MRAYQPPTAPAAAPAPGQALGIAVLALLLLGSCSAPRPAPPAPPAPAPASSPRPVAAPLPPGPAVHWRDAPITPGDWRWSREGSASVARFGGDLFAMACDPVKRTVTLLRRGSAGADVPMTIITFHQSRPLSGHPASHQANSSQPGAGAQPAVGVTLAAGDPLLDAMALSRGRFAVETAGLPTLYLPSWPEVTRVVEDCR